MTIPSTPLTDAAWRGLSASVDSDDELAPLRELVVLSRRLERANAVLVEALERLEKAEHAYRSAHDVYGDGSHQSGYRWDRMRDAGNEARAALEAAGKVGE